MTFNEQPDLAVGSAEYKSQKHFMDEDFEEIVKAKSCDVNLINYICLFAYRLQSATNWIMICHLYMMFIEKWCITRGESGSALSRVSAIKGIWPM